MIDITVAEYLSNIFSRQDAVIMNDFNYVMFPVLSITVLIFSLRSIVQVSNAPKMKKTMMIKINQIIFRNLRKIYLFEPSFLN